jgi:hypothetical protein
MHPVLRSTCRTGWLLLALAALGCAETPNAKPPGPGKLAADESLTPEQYVRLGLPDLHREWSAEDMAKAAKVLSSQKGNQLPRYKSKQSGAVFARLTSIRNLDVYRGKTLPLDTRYLSTLAYFQNSNEVLKAYVGAFLRYEVTDSEMVELLAAQFRLGVVMLDLVDEYLPTMKKDDPSLKVRINGLDQMRRDLATVVVAGLQTLSERKTYRQSERARLVDYMKETFPAIIPRIPPASRGELLTGLDRIQIDPTLKELQPGLGELRFKVRTALGPNN